ncbi:hypothetical protein BBK36DRAFT_1203298 [Trichoderma citrinoviride]|uniref:Uncharacterized protein n=1 Tax=Trichoderma citrinoviride TaxID=58853 RepID=A0A2T4B9T6_9HYPO|nr:hypothetical protein BBK36DRAFT_1203298 [Trichoderma citrinoviride]PTB65979.1 hypothetical protein BBK36DRAFT_1203298 [Trichoderma citrinoviride]
MPGTNFDVIQSVPRVATLIYQTHQLWQEIREVPDGIRDLVDHLKALEPIFADIEDQFSQDEASTPFKNCLDLSRKAHDSLGALVADMRTQLQAKKSVRRKYAAVKILLNKTVLARLEQSLSRLYELISEPAIAGWTYTYRVYNVIPDNSEIIARVKMGDVVGVRQMFSSRKASPFDKSQGGESLLHYAASNRRYEICQLLLKLGLQPLLDSRGRYESPAESIAGDMVSTIIQKRSWPAERHPKRIADLFASYLQEPDSLPAERLLDFIREFSPDDMMVSNFRNLFMPNYYLRMLRDRLEAVRLGAFNVLDVKTFGSLLSEDRTFSKADVSQSTREKISLVHSAALALGCRYPETLVRYQKPRPWLNAYSERWGDVVTKVVSVATLDDLTSIETVVPWDAYEVTAWEGTPLMSLIGGALCYLCPNISFNHWDGLFHGCLHKWLVLLQSAGVNLLEYGKRERAVLHDLQKNTKGAFDADAIDASRTMLRHPMTQGTPKAKLYHMGVKKSRKRGEAGGMFCVDRSGEEYWIPFRIIDLEVGQDPSDWKLIWAPEFEHMACQFWDSLEPEKVLMPGAWMDW